MSRFSAELFQDDSQGAEAGERRLQQVGANKGGEPEPVAVVEDRAAGDAEAQSQKNHKAGEGENDAFHGHESYLAEFLWDDCRWIEIRAADKEKEENISILLLSFNLVWIKDIFRALCKVASMEFYNLPIEFYAHRCREERCVPAAHGPLNISR